MDYGAEGRLSTYFWMVTLLAYLAYVRRPGLGRYAWVVVSFTVGLMSKPMGIVLFQQGKAAEAIAHYQEALRIRPDYPEAHHDLGVALGSQGRIDDAIREFLWALRGKPDQAESHYDLGVLYRQKGNTKEAIQHLEAALRLVPDYADARRVLNQIQTPIPPAPGQGGNR